MPRRKPTHRLVKTLLLCCLAWCFAYSPYSLSNPASDTNSQQTQSDNQAEKQTINHPNQSENPKDGSSQSPEEKLNIQFIDIPHNIVSNNIERLSRTLDMFFSNETIYEESTGSYIRIRNNVVVKKGGEISFDTNIRTKLELPKTKKKLQLLIRNEDDDEELASSSLSNAIGDDDYSTSLRRLLKLTKELNAHIDAGVKIRSQLDPFVRLRMRVTDKLGSAEIKWIESLSWFDTEGWRSSTIFDYRNKIFNNSLGRISSQLLVGNRLDHTSFIQSIAVYNAEHHNTFYYEVSALLTDKPTVQASNYVASAVYKSKIYKNWAYISVGPQLNFSRENGFRTEPAFILQFEANFGDVYR